MTAISVIIPTYNRPELVPLAIDSVLAQTHPETEIIVVDDGSRQDMREVLKHYGSKIRIIRQENAGLSGARNTGINAASHDWVAFLDDDDEYAPDRLARAAESIKRFPDASAHLTNTAIVGDGKPPINLFELRGLDVGEWAPVERPLTWVLRGCFFSQSLVAKRATLIEIGLFRKTFYEDLDIFVRLTRHCPWIMDCQPTLRLIRRSNTNAMSDDWRSRPVEKCTALIRIYKEALQLPGLIPAEIQQIRTSLGTYQFELGSALLNLRQSGSARQQFRDAAKTFPSTKSRLKCWVAFLFGTGAVKLTKMLRRKETGLVR